MKKSIFSLSLQAFFFFILSQFSYAEEQIIKIGQSLPISGKNSQAADSFLNGTRLWIQYVNENGGIKGSKIELITLDDKGNPEICAENTEILISKNVLLLFGYMGHESVIKAYKIAEKSGIPFFGASSGASEIHAFAKKNTFTIRPGYYDEINKFLDLLIENEVKKISFFSSDNPIGKDCLKSAQWSFGEKGIKFFNKESSTRKAEEVKKAAEKIVSGGSEAVIVAADSETAEKFIRAVRSLNSPVKIMTVSSAGGEKISKNLMNLGIGVVVSQPVPFPFYRKIPVAGHYNSLNEKYSKGKKISFSGLEGFIYAKVLTTILSKTEKFSKENFIKTTIKLRPLNIGGFSFNFTPKNHTGSKMLYLNQIGPGGFLSPIRSINDVYKFSSF